MAFEDAIELTFLEHWYDDLEDWTIPSTLIPLGGADLAALARRRQFRRELSVSANADPRHGAAQGHGK